MQRKERKQGAGRLRREEGTYIWEHEKKNGKTQVVEPGFQDPSWREEAKQNRSHT